MKNIFPTLLSSPKLLGSTAFVCAFVAVSVTFGLVNNDAVIASSNETNNRVFMVGPGNTQASIANGLNKPQKPIIETAVSAAKSGLEGKTKTYLQSILEDLAKGFSDGYNGK